MKLRKSDIIAAITLILLLLTGCNSSSVNDAIDDGEELINGPERKTIDTSRLGINAFVNDARFGGVSAQFGEVSETLGIRYVRLLFNWDDQVQPSAAATPNFSFYDAIAASIPSGLEAIVVLNGVPSWVSGAHARSTFVDQFVRKIAQRYRSNGRIVGWEIWNEPNMVSEVDNQTLGLVDSPENYVELLAMAHSVIKSISPNKLVINAATTAINQNFPDSLDYNQRLVAAGGENFIDRYNVHYYGRQFENVVVPGGVAEFLNGRAAPIWVTESGAQGVNNQLAYGEQVWPFLLEKVPAIARIYIYQFTEATPSGSTYGLKNLSSDFPVSDLYLSLRDRHRG